MSLSANFCTAPKRENAEAAKEAKTARARERRRRHLNSPRAVQLHNGNNNAEERDDDDDDNDLSGRMELLELLSSDNSPLVRRMGKCGRGGDGDGDGEGEMQGT